MGRVAGKIALVTGATGGIGEAIARTLAREGASVTITDLDNERCRRVAEDIGADWLRQDVTQEHEWNDIVHAIERKHGALHVLVNSAGIEGQVGAGNPENTELVDWKRVHAVNLDGVFLGCRAALPAMRRAGGGSIVNLASIVSFFATPNSTAYGSSKAAVTHLTMTVAVHGAQHGSRVRCNSVHPGMIDTRMLRNIFTQGAKRLGLSLEEIEQRQLARIPMGELGMPEDIAQAVLYLASDDARYVTATHLNVDGGWNAA